MAGRKKIAELCNDIFLLITQLRQRQDFGDPETLRRRISRLFNELDQHGRELTIDSEDLRDAKFALVAFIDEIIQSSNWYGASTWMTKPLAVEYFSTFIAGEEFYKKLEELRARAHTKAEVLEVYYLCLTLGFAGQYYGSDKLRLLIDDVYHDLSKGKERSIQELSPHWHRTDELITRVSDVPPWAIVLSGVGLGLLFFLIIKAILAGKLNDVLAHLNELIK